MAEDLKPHLQRYGTLLPEEICPVNVHLDWFHEIHRSVATAACNIFFTFDLIIVPHTSLSSPFFLFSFRFSGGRKQSALLAFGTVSNLDHSAL